jgi:Pilus formation protein N terminal region
MAVVFEFRRRRLLGLVTAAFCATACSGVSLAQADVVNVHVDQARVIKLPERVATIIIGNPLIADATLQSGGILVLTGKGFGATNLLALDHSGQVVVEDTVHVVGVTGDNLVVVYKGVDRESYSCNPKCEPRITLGDSTAYFNSTLAQTGSRNGQAQANAAR